MTSQQSQTVAVAAYCLAREAAVVGASKAPSSSSSHTVSWMMMALKRLHHHPAHIRWLTQRWPPTGRDFVHRCNDDSHDTTLATHTVCKASLLPSGPPQWNVIPKHDQNRLLFFFRIFSLYFYFHYEEMQYFCPQLFSTLVPK